MDDPEPDVPNYPPPPQVQPIVVVIDEAALAGARGGAGGYGGYGADDDGSGSGYLHPGGSAGGSNDSNGDGIPDDATTLNIIHDMQRNLARTIKRGVNAVPYGGFMAARPQYGYY